MSTVTTTTALLELVDWAEVNERVSREQRNREVYVPPISLYRWWARRPHALIGALIDAACSDGAAPSLADPFSGGGTVALEAARRGLPIYAQDLHPWPVKGLATALDRVDPSALAEAAESVLARLDPLRRSLYGTLCPVHEAAAELTHVFWARRTDCPICETTVFLFPYSLVSVASRSRTEIHGWYGCRSCGRVSRHRLSTQRPRCPHCGITMPSADEPLLSGRSFTCTNRRCGETVRVFAGEQARWETVLVQRACHEASRLVTHLDVPTQTEAATAATDPRILTSIREPIPDGIETSILRRAGFDNWSDVMPPRQLTTMAGAVDVINVAEVDERVSGRLRLALCGAVEMAGYLSRWDRYYPKAFEAMANHRFPALGLACETNLLAERGRGTIPRRFAHSVAAARWAHSHLSGRIPARTLDASARRRRLHSGALLACGSSERQLPPKESVDLVITDPPYFDDVQYGELASMLLVWARALRLLPCGVTLDLTAEAVVNSVRGTGVDEYRALLTRIFRETRRTMRHEGRLVITFHNTDMRAWWALARALCAAGLGVVALAVAVTENSDDHPKRNRRSFTQDLVLECQPAFRGSPIVLYEAAESNDDQTRELLAAGRAVAAGGSVDLATFCELLVEQRGPLPRPRINERDID
jgi:putative DNA methylase